MISRLSRRPGVNECAISLPSTATATVPPAWRPELSTPAARPALLTGSASSSIAVIDGMAKPSPTPTGMSSTATRYRSVVQVSVSMPAAATSWPVQIGSRGPNRADARAEARLADDTSALIGRNSRPVSSADRPSARWKNKLSTKITP
jgi:hypothetical protein